MAYTKEKQINYIVVKGVKATVSYSSMTGNSL